MTRTNKKLHIRALAVLLVLVNLFTLMPLPTHSADNTGETAPAASFTITYDDEAVTSLTIFSYEKKQVSVEGNAVAEAYQWQIRHPERTDLWVNIYDATFGYLNVTLALVKNMLDSDNTAQLRCRVNANGGEYYTPALTVYFSEEDDGIPVVLADPTEPTVPEETVPETTAPETTVPEETIPETTVPETTVPETTVPEETVPETTVPETTVPEETVPETTVPETTAPEETIPETTVPETTASEEIIPETTAPEAILSEETIDVASEVNEAIPAETEAEAPVLSAAAEEVVESATVMAEAAPAEETTPTPAEETTPAPLAEGDGENTDEGNAEGEGGTVEQEFVSVTVNFTCYDFAKDADGKLLVDSNGQPYLEGDDTASAAFTSYIASLRNGTPLTTEVPCPTMVGYDIKAGANTTIRTDADTGAKYVVIALDSVTKNETYTVRYEPALVNYTVHYYFQNIYDDLYVEDTSKKEENKLGHTGSTPDTSLLNRYYDGFLSLYYQPDFIAADGSTVFEVYYERNYYLMEFDCAGGYGSETLYVRYGSYISVPNPVKSGHAFDGWDLVRTVRLDANDSPVLDADGNHIVEDVEDGVKEAEGLPATMPPYNTAYRAVWKEVNATYTIAYWLKNGNETTYLGSYLESAKTGTPVTGSDSLGHTGIGAVCGQLGHDHTEECFVCKIGGHVHDTSCVPAGIISVGAQITGGTDYNDMEAARAKAGNKISANGVYLYLIQSGYDISRNRYWPKLYVAGSYYNITIYNSDHFFESNTNVWALMVNGKNGAIADGSSTNTATIYELDLTAGCNKAVHTHSKTCYTCGLEPHEHSISCYAGPLARGDEVNDQNGWNAMLAANNNLLDTTEGYIYFTGGIGSSDYYPKMFFGGKFYNVTVNGQSPISEATLRNIVEGEQLGYGTYGNAFVVKYKAKLACGTEAHSHTDACFVCGMHQHSLECRQDSHYLIYLDEETQKDNQGKVVEGDGSTVVNVYYSYKTYTLRYFYAKKENNEEVKDDNGNTVYDENGAPLKGVYYVVGGTTWPFGGSDGKCSESTTVLELLGKVSEWGKVKAEPQIKSEYLTGDTKRYNTDTLTTDDGSTTYYYLEYQAVYGQNLENLWPIDIFEPVEIKGSHSQCPGLDYAYFSAWNGEHCVKYSTDVRENGLNGGNYTIKGLYMKLDDHVIFDRKFENKAKTTLVSFLGFWDNGYEKDWSVPKEFRYHIMKEFEGTEEEKDPHKTYRTYKGKEYELYKEFLVYDDSDLEKVEKQTVVALEGYTHIGTLTEAADNDKDYTLDTPDLPNVDYFFYYDRTKHIITFWNHSEYLSDGRGSHVAYGTNLQQYGPHATSLVYNAETNPDGKYPSTLEPGAYVFDGWYTSSLCLPGTEMNWNQTMPDNDFVVYAKWTPVTHNVYFYADYQDYIDKDTWEQYDQDGKAIDYPIQISHGELLGTAYNKKPEAEEGYTFIGWFYMDEDNKKRFAPDTMEITRDLYLFAEWTTAIDTTYEIKYVLAEDVAAGNTPSNKAYKAGDSVADLLFAHSSVGKTKTFNAKSLNDLKSDFRTAFFPTVNSHSILMDPVPTNNTYTFEYVHDPLVWYKVRYVDYATKLELVTAKVASTDKAIVTEKFLPIAGYIPQNYYIRKTLASDGDRGPDDIIDQNVITFYYVLDTEHGMYSVEYYLENLGAPEPPAANADDDVIKAYLESNYTVRDSRVGPADLNTRISAAEQDKTTVPIYAGYTYQPEYNTVINYVKRDENGDIVFENGQPVLEETVKRGADDTGDPPTGYVDVGGLTIKVYYRRNKYDYKIQYRESGTEKILATVETNQKHFGSIIEHTAQPEFVDDKGTTDASDDITYEYYISGASEQDRTGQKTIRAFTTGQDNPNILIFYYTQKQVEVRYHAVWFDSDKHSTAEYGNVSINAEKGTITGSTATPAFGFTFEGWYKDEKCTQPVEASWVTGNKLVPQILYQDEDWINHYYAKFEPVRKDLTIMKDGNNLDKNDTFLFHIEGRDALNQKVDMIVSIQGTESVTIKDLYCGTYTVTELTGWSWTYDVTSADSQEASLTVNGEDGEVTFTNAVKPVDWLHGETCDENQFQN